MLYENKRPRLQSIEYLVSEQGHGGNGESYDNPCFKWLKDKIIEQCWLKEPELRPSFEEVVKRLTEYMKKPDEFELPLPGQATPRGHTAAKVSSVAIGIRRWVGRRPGPLSPPPKSKSAGERPRTPPPQQRTTVPEAKRPRTPEKARP